MSKLEFTVPRWRVTAISPGRKVPGMEKHNKKDGRRAEAQTEEWRGGGKKGKTIPRDPTYRFSLSCSSLTLKSC